MPDTPDSPERRSQGQTLKLGCCRQYDGTTIRPWKSDRAPSYLKSSGSLRLRGQCAMSFRTSAAVHGFAEVLRSADDRRGLHPWPRFASYFRRRHAHPGLPCQGPIAGAANHSARLGCTGLYYWKCSCICPSVRPWDRRWHGTFVCELTIQPLRKKGDWWSAILGFVIGRPLSATGRCLCFGVYSEPANECWPHPMGHDCLTTPSNSPSWQIVVSR